MLDDELPAVSIARLVLTLTPRGPAAAAIEQALMSAEQLAAALQLLGEAPVAWGLQESRRSLGVVEQSFAGVPDLPRRQIGLSLEALVLDWLTALIDRAARGASVQFIPPMAREAARLEVPFGDVIESMRATQGRCIAAIFAAHTTASRASSPHVAQELVSTTAEVFDTEIGRFLGVYMAEREAVVESQLARRRDVVAELLSDTSCEDSPGLRLDLGIDLHRFQVGIVVMRESGAPGLDSRPLKRAICAALDDAQVLIIPAGHNRLWAWVGTVMEPDHVCHDGLRKALAAQTGIRAAVGAPAPGVVGFRETHRQALDAAALQGYDSPGEPVTFWREHALLALLGLDVERARTFTHRVLGALAASSPAASEQRLTLRAYLENGHSLRQAALLRNVHRNTVVYRLRRAEELLGRPLTDHELELRCALLIAERLGEATLA